MGLNCRQLHDHLALPLLPLVAEIGLRGLPFDGAKRQAMVADLERRIADCDTELFAAGISKPNSPMAVSRALVERGVPLTRKTEAGKQFITDLDVLCRLDHNYNNTGLAPKYPVLKPLILRRRLEKARENLMAYVPCDDSKIRTSLRSTGTATGRFSSSRLGWCPICRKKGHGMNLQNVSKNNPEIGVNVRDVFAAPPGYVYVEHDYSGLELRVMAYIAGDEKMISRFENNEDLHRIHAEMLFEGRYDSKLRTLAKNFFYAWRGGGKEQAIQVALAKKGEYLEQSVLREYIQKMDREYSRTVAWQHNRATLLAFQRAHKQPQLVYNAFGRPRLLLGYDPLKDALANEIQATAADIMNFCILRLSRNPGVWPYIVLQVHDSLVGVVPKARCESYCAAVKAEMERPVWMCERSIVYPVEAKVGERWSEMEEVKL